MDRASGLYLVTLNNRVAISVNANDPRIADRCLRVDHRHCKVGRSTDLARRERSYARVFGASNVNFKPLALLSDLAAGERCALRALDAFRMRGDTGRRNEWLAGIDPVAVECLVLSALAASGIEHVPGALAAALARPSASFAQREFLDAARHEAALGLGEGGIPIGSVLVHRERIVGRGHNRRVQRGSAILHGEMDALENAGRMSATIYRECTLYTTLSPCAMCSGAIILYGIPRVVIGENRSFMGEEAWLRSHGVSLDVIDDPACVTLMADFIRMRPDLWNEDIGVD